MARGHGPVEDANTNCCLRRLCAVLRCLAQKKGLRLRPSKLTDVLDKAGLAGVELEKFMSSELLNFAWFCTVWDLTSKVWKFYDAGQGYWN